MGAWLGLGLASLAPWHGASTAQRPPPGTLQTACLPTALLPRPPAAPRTGPSPSPHRTVLLLPLSTSRPSGVYPGAITIS